MNNETGEWAAASPLMRRGAAHRLKVWDADRDFLRGHPSPGDGAKQWGGRNSRGCHHRVADMFGFAFQVLFWPRPDNVNLSIETHARMA